MSALLSCILISKGLKVHLESAQDEKSDLNIKLLEIESHADDTKIGETWQQWLLLVGRRRSEHCLNSRTASTVPATSFDNYWRIWRCALFVDKCIGFSRSLWMTCHQLCTFLARKRKEDASAVKQVTEFWFDSTTQRVLLLRYFRFAWTRDAQECFSTCFMTLLESEKERTLHTGSTPKTENKQYGRAMWYRVIEYSI